MAGNSFGTFFKLTSFGESHGQAVGGVLDGCPANVSIDVSRVQNELNRRRPGQSHVTTQRDEKDQVEFLSGIFEGKTIASPIAFIVRNEDQQSSDYDHLKHVFRPSHADFTYQQKFGFRDHRGGGRSSARETVARVIAGAIARQYLEQFGISVWAYTRQIGRVALDVDYKQIDQNLVDHSVVRCPVSSVSERMISLVEELRAKGETTGGIIDCVAQGIPAGLGEPVFDKLNADLAKAMLSINAVKGFEIGSGFSSVSMHGSEHNDLFNSDGSTKSNHSGGIQGGISNGEDIYFSVAFKPVATVMQQQETIDDQGNKVVLDPKGRHDPCVVPRAVPIVEAMCLLVLADHFLRAKALK